MKIKLSRFLGVFLGLSLVLTGCKDKKGGGGSQEEGEGGGTPTTSLLTPSLIQANVTEEHDGIIPEKVAPVNALTLDLDDYDVIDDRYLNRGLLVVRGDNGYVGFYSLLHNDWLISKRIDAKNLEYSVRTYDTSDIGFLLTLNDGYNDYILDAFGNDYYDDIYNRSIAGCYGAIVDETYYFVIATYQNYSSELSYYYYSFDQNGTASRVYEIPDSVNPFIPTEPEHDLLDVGLLVDDSFEDLTPYGQKNCFLATDHNGNYTFYRQSKTVASFFVDNSYTFLGVVGGNAYFQKSQNAPEDAEEYDYFDGQNKKYLNHIVVELATGTKNETKLNALFEDIDYVNGVVEGEYVQVVSFKPITSDKCLGASEEHLADKNFNMLDIVSGIHINDFVLYKEGTKNRFFNETTKILYDENLKVITYLGDVNPQYRADVNMFECTRDGKHGLVDLNGIVYVSFNYDTIHTDSLYEDRILAEDDGIAYEVTISKYQGTYSNYENKLGTELITLGGDDEHYSIYRYKSSESYYTYYSPKTQVLFTSSVNNPGVYSSIDYMAQFNVIYAQDLNLDVHVLKNEDFTPREVPSGIKGSEESSTLGDGKSYDRPYEINVASQSSVSLYTRGLEYIYVKFYVTAVSNNGYYYVSYDYSKLQYYGVYTGNVDEYSYSSYSGIGFAVTTTNYVIVQFYVKNSTPAYDHLNDYVTLYTEDSGGLQRSYPYVIKAFDEAISLSVPKVESSTYTRYVKFVAPTAGVYSFNTSYYSSISSLYALGASSNQDISLTKTDAFYMERNETRSFKIVFNYDQSQHQVCIDLNNYAELSYDFNDTYNNYIEYSGTSTKYLVLSASPNVATSYTVSVSTNTISKMFASDSVAPVKTVTFDPSGSNKVLVVFNSTITSGSTRVTLTAKDYSIRRSLDNYPCGFTESTSNAGYFSSSIYGDSAMSITANLAGTLQFTYNVTVDSYYDGLEVYKNGIKQTTLSGSSYYNLEVNSGDVVVLRYYSYYGYYSSYGATVSSFSIYY